MKTFFLSLHVVAAILAVGPVAVAASMFPAFQRREAGSPGPALLHRICRVYAAVSLAVPVLGFATGATMGVLGDPWVGASIALTALAAVLLVLAVLPGQEYALTGEGPATGAWAAPRLGMFTGVFNLLWVAVTVLMIARPGSSA
ncbi:MULTISPECIES: hypothetical protein [unclassified Streptomyces]|uniref:hypothetical protein n=1 Tax=unclassified Streptomyces TaxID=2593676 RepID=UPI00081F67DF|nr:hypothetical protein [Streptomyces sp. LcepLS]MYR26594.1 hypothetical protein [Streptomyces sp. SID4945]SCF07046.1 hypothetical protein GA0115257_10664 [Streptomyces sp. LcepLS]